MDVLSSDIHSRRMSKQIGFKFIIDSKRLRLNKNGNLGAVSCNKLLISQMFRLNGNLGAVSCNKLLISQMFRLNDN
jgi:hypothetical protein